MNQSLLIGRFFGTEIRLHISLLLLIPYSLIAFKPNSFIDAARVLGLIAAIFACVALHEMGHTLAAHWAGIQVSSIVLWPLGGFANLTRRPEKLWHDIAISAAGPLTNLALFLGFAGLTLLEQLLERSMAFPGISQGLYQANLFPALMSLTVANLSLALFNLVPIYPLDGGQITRGLLKWGIGEKYADWVMLILSFPLALALTGVGFAIRDFAVILTGVILLLGALSLNNQLADWLSLGWLYLVDRAGYYLRRQDYDAAVAAYTRVIQHNPERAGAYASRAVAWIDLNEYAAARRDIDQTLLLDPNRFSAWTMRGELLETEGDDTAALAALNQSIKINPHWTPTYLIRARVFQKQGNYALALADLDLAIDQGQGAPAGFILRSMLRAQTGDQNGALADIAQAQRFAPEWGLIFPEIFLHNLRGQLDWALVYYWTAMQRLPNAYQCLQGRADACRVNQRLDWAIVDYTRAIQLAPRLAELFLKRGRAYFDARQFAQASADFRQAAQLAPFNHIRRQAQELLDQILITEQAGNPPLSQNITRPATPSSKSASAAD